MIRYSYVSLIIPCDAQSAVTITEILGVQPTRVREYKSWGHREDGDREELLHHSWELDSPKSHTDCNPTERLAALADVIEPFASRLPNLRPQFRAWVDILYHITPQHARGVTGEFDWFRVPAELMRRYGAWDLDVSYETIWFDHPDWVSPARRSWWGRLLESLQRP
jgi:hypothetical protein